jgi:hypothetical protein
LKKTITSNEIPAAWNPDSLFNKAQRYVEKMTEADCQTWEHALWSSLTLEFVARAALSNVNPALLADYGDRNWSSLLHSLGYTPTESKFSPKSISIVEVVRRLGEIFPNFDREVENFCKTHVGKRNGELHSGETPFDGVPVSTWQPNFFKAIDILMASMGMKLEDLVGEDEAATARKLIAAAADEKAKAVKGDVDAHKKVWKSKSQEERNKLAQSASVWATRNDGHRVKCPACNSESLLYGEAISAPTQKLENDTIIEKQEYLPAQLECIACGLKISGYSRLNAVGLGDRYINTTHYDAAEYYAPEDEYYGYEEDNNEPF